MKRSYEQFEKNSFLSEFFIDNFKFEILKNSVLEYKSKIEEINMKYDTRNEHLTAYAKILYLNKDEANKKKKEKHFLEDEIISDKESNFYHEWTKKKEHNINDESHHFPQKVNELKQNLLDTSDNLSGLMSEMEFRKGENEEEKEGEKWKDEEIEVLSNILNNLTRKTIKHSKDFNIIEIIYEQFKKNLEEKGFECIRTSKELYKKIKEDVKHILEIEQSKKLKTQKFIESIRND